MVYLYLSISIYIYLYYTILYYSILPIEDKVLVIGAGGIGSEHLKNLALAGIRNIHVIDMDTIDLTNLNRQFLFRMKDVGKGKAEVAAEFVMRRVPTCKITHYNNRIQDMNDDFYRQFKVIVCGLDNVEARRWINSKIHSLVEKDADGNIANFDSVIPMVDGGTEGFAGQAQIIIPFCGVKCFECSTALFPPQKVFQLCTLASKPRIPEHCVAWVTQIRWDELRKGEKMDFDNPEHVQWIFERASERADQFGIKGVTYFLTLGVAKNIIPAVASSNAIVSASCCNEVIKLLTYRGHTLNNYLSFNGQEGFSASYEDVKKIDNCKVCGKFVPVQVLIPSDEKVSDFIARINAHPSFQTKSPSLFGPYRGGAGAIIYVRNMRSSHENLELPMSQFVNSGEMVEIHDPEIAEQRLGAIVVFEPSASS